VKSALLRSFDDPALSPTRERAYRIYRTLVPDAEPS
jgi:hypothetical protein